jgi:hypothetical protein
MMTIDHLPRPLTTGMKLITCEDSGIEFAQINGSWTWRTVCESDIHFDWMGRYSTKAQAIDACFDYCGFDDLIEED